MYIKRESIGREERINIYVGLIKQILHSIKLIK